TVGFLLAGAAFATAEPSVFIAIFVGNGLSFVVVAVMVRRVLSRAGAVVELSAPAATTAAAAGVRSPFRDRWCMVFTVGNGVLSLYDTVLIVLLPIWVIEQTAVPVALVPVLMAVNTVLTVLLQVYVTRFADSPAAAIRLLVLSGVLMAVCSGFFAMAQAASATFAILAILVAVVVLSVAENIQEVAAWELSAELSPEAARARYLGAFSLGFSGQKVIGPTLLVVVLLPTGLIAWPVLAGAFGTAALISRTAAHRCLAERGIAVTSRPTNPQTIEVNS
ncbi:MAG: MFS transporter, partial [Mycobacterium sp.]